MFLLQQMRGADDSVERRAELVAHVAHKPGLGSSRLFGAVPGLRDLHFRLYEGGDLLFVPLFFGVQQSQNNIEEDDDQQKVDDDVELAVVVDDDVRYTLEPGIMRWEDENDDQQVQRRKDDKARDNEVILPNAEEEDHGHDKGEQIEKRCLVRALYIAKGERVQVDKENAEEGRDRGEAFQVEKDEDEQYKNANDLNSGALHHAIRDVIKEVDKVATHGHYDERIEPPEAGLGILDR